MDISKNLNGIYRTRNGKRVINLQYVPTNYGGYKVTYPIKGSVVVREKPLKTCYTVWSIEGKYDVVTSPHEWDLIEELNP